MDGDGQLCILLLRRADQCGERIGRIGHHPQIAETLQAFGKRRGILARQTIAEPNDIGGAGRREAVQPRQRSGAVDRPRQRRKRVGRRTRIGGAQQRDRPGHLAAGQRRRVEEDDLAVLAFGLIYDLAHHPLPHRPVMRGGPAVVDDQDERPAGGEPRAGIEQRMGEGQDDERGECHAQEDEPERRAGRRFLARHQSEKQPDRREAQPSRCRRGDPQEPPQDRQNGETDEQPGRGEGEGAERQHAA